MLAYLAFKFPEIPFICFLLQEFPALFFQAAFPIYVGDGGIGGNTKLIDRTRRKTNKTN